MAQAAVRLRLLLLCLGRVALGADVNVSSVDLSAHHGRLTRAFDVAPTRLSADQLARFREDGYVARVPLLDRAGVAALSAEIDALTTAHANDSRWHEFHANEGTDDARLCHGLGHWRIGALSHDLVFHPTVAAIAAQLLPGGAGPRLFHDQAFIKPSARGGPVSYHQDYSYWTRTKPMRHLTFHVALDDCDDERIGGLELVAGSHRWRDAPLPITDLHFGDLASISRALTADERARFAPAPARLRAGELAVFHPLTIHGSRPNTAGRTRRALVVNVIGDGVRFDPADGARHGANVVLDGIPPLAAGEKLEGQFFPLLLDAEDPATCERAAA